ncbi:MAG TPA: C-GCAxxG-C-C family protein, partial [Candidatus Lokiarchaeia archaeon]
AYELGIKYEKECTGCAQTVIAAIFEALGIWSEDVFKAASGLANGLGLSGDGSCAALLGASMVIGYIFGRERKDFGEIYKPMKSYGLVKKLHNLFTKEYGACRCYDVQRKMSKVTWHVLEINAMDEHFRNQMVDMCSKVVGNVARLATKLILEGGFVPVKQEKKTNA